MSKQSGQWTMTRFWKNGELYVWATASAVSITFLILLVLIFVVLRNGLGHFWPSELERGVLKDGKTVMGEFTRRELAPDGSWRSQFKVGNRDLYGQDFRWIPEAQFIRRDRPPEAISLERRESGNFYGFLKSLTLPAVAQGTGGTLWEQLLERRDAVAAAQDKLARPREEMNDLSYEMEQFRLEIRKLKYDGGADNLAEAREVEKELVGLREVFQRRNEEYSRATAELRANKAVFADASGKEKTVALADIVRAYRPNQMSVWAKTGFYLGKFWELLSGEPREANTEGGLFPAIFGTVLMVLIMSAFAIPLGVVAAIYLREYAKEGWLVRMVRIAVYNLAGVPSIVYGVFGLGFFVYGVGGGIDQVFFPERLPTPTFGTGGILWASLTLSLMTVPVVIVATEEAFASIPRGIREGSLSLGATQFQTLMRVLLPMATPGIMTGFILAMARAAGEVAPLMITGVVKLAPALPLDGQFPFLHLDRKFMHLGFHIFDVGFQSPNVEAAKPMVYITTLLLVLIVLIMSLSAIHFRNRMRKRFQTATF